MSKLIRFGLLAILGVALSFSPAHAIRLTLAPSNDVNGGGVVGVPSFTDLTPGQEFDVYVWLAHEDDGFVNGYSLDLYATTPGVVEAVSSEILNPNVVTRIPDVGDLFPTPRFPADDRVLRIPQLNTNGALVWNGAIGRPTGRGIDSANGIVVTSAPGVVDTGYDGVNDTFLVQSVRLRVLDDAAGKSTGLAMHVGQLGFGIDNALPDNPQFVFFGDGTTQVAANDVGGTDGGIHAMITVEGGVTRTELVIVNGDPTGAMNVPFEGRRPVNVPIGGPAAKLAIDNGFAGVDSFFDVFFDVEIAGDSNTDLAGLMDMLSMQGFDVKSGRSLPSGPNGESMDYDFGIRLGELGGGGQTILDVDFGANGVTGVTLNNVAVPEPSSFILAGLGCVVALGLRRRKSV